MPVGLSRLRTAAHTLLIRNCFWHLVPGKRWRCYNRVVSGYQEAALIDFPVAEAGIVPLIWVDDNLFLPFWPHGALSGKTAGRGRLVLSAG